MHNTASRGQLVVGTPEDHKKPGIPHQHRDPDLYPG
jgi:hypothetical protein